MIFARFRSEASRSYTVLGKVPARADFVRIHANQPAAADLDEALPALVEVPAAFDAMPAGDLVWRAKSPRGQAFLGGLAPSRDASGRRYPFVAGLLLPAEEAAAYGPALLLGAELFLARLRELASRARLARGGIPPLQHYLELQASARDRDLLEPGLARELLERYLVQQPLQDLARSLPAPQAGLRQAALLLLSTAAGEEDAPAHLCFPLSPEPGHAVLQACLWLDLLGRADQGRGIWGQQALLRPVEGRPALLVQAGRPAGRAFRVMAGAVPVRPGDADAPAAPGRRNRHPMLPDVARKLDHFFTNKTASLMDFHQFLGATIRQVYHP